MSLVHHKLSIILYLKLMVVPSINLQVNMDLWHFTPLNDTFLMCAAQTDGAGGTGADTLWTP